MVGRVGVWVWQQDKTKIPDRNGLKFGTVVVLYTVSKVIDFGFNMSRVRGTGSSLRTFDTSCHLVNKTGYYYVDNIKLHNTSQKIFVHFINFIHLCYI